MRPKKLLLSLLLLSSTAFAGWSSSGPTGGAMNAVVVAPSDSNVIWAANSAGVYRSVDGGATWTNVSGPVADAAFLVVHPTNADKAWVFSQPAGVYRTDDGGATWTALHALAGTAIPTSFFIDPRQTDTLYASGNCYAGVDVAFLPGNGAYRSTDGGATWKTLSGVGGLSLCVAEMAIDPFSPWRLFTTGAYGSRLESYDRAQTWERPDDARPSRAVLFDPRYPYTHYGIASPSAFVVSQDGGFTWSTATTKPPAPPRALTIDPRRGRLFLGTSDGLFRSGDGGRVWAGTLLPESSVNAVDFARAPDVLFAATGQGMFRVVNHGLGEAQGIDLNDISSNVIAFDVDPGDGHFLYAGTSDAVLGSAAPVHGHVFRSTDDGASWELLPGDNGVEIDQIAVGAGGTVYASSRRALTLYRRGRDDAEWTVVRTKISTGTMAVDAKNVGTLFIHGPTGIELSRDFGANWQSSHLVSYLPYLAVDPSDGRWVYAAGEYNFYRSSDGGDTWVDLQPPGFINGTRGLVVAPSNGMVLYRIGANGGSPRPERSDDRGVTWRAATLPGGIYPSTFAVDPHDEKSVWATADTLFFGIGLFHSTDGGASWTKVNGPFGTPISATAMRFDPSGSVLHFAFPGHGVWELPIDAPSSAASRHPSTRFARSGQALLPASGEKGTRHTRGECESLFRVSGRGWP